MGQAYQKADHSLITQLGVDETSSRKDHSYITIGVDMAQESKIVPCMAFVKTVNKHWDGILNYITSKLTNGILEGINSKIHLIKRRPRGYRNTTNFINIDPFVITTQKSTE